MVLLGGIVITDGLSARAQSDDDDADEAGVVEQFTLTEQQFDQMVFGDRQQRVPGWEGRVISSDMPSATAARQRMELMLSNELNAVDRLCSLTAAQMKKLNLAGRGDIVRWLNRVLELRRKCTSVAMNRQQYTALMTQLQQPRYVPQFGVFGETSLFRKTLPRALTEEQLVRYRLLERARQVRTVEDAVLAWDGRTKSLASVQRQKLIDVVIAKAHPPQTMGPYTQYILLLQAGQLEDELKPLMDDTQWARFQTQVTVAKQMEPTLRALGQWPASSTDDDDESPTDATTD